MTRLATCALSFILLSLALARPATAEVIGEWRFNEKTPGATAASTAGAIHDSSGNGLHLTAAGDPLPTYTAGGPIYGGTAALQFTSGSDHLYLSQQKPTNSQNLVVGAFNNGARQFQGEIDFLRISKGVLEPADFVSGTLSIVDLQPENNASFRDSCSFVVVAYPAV